VTLREQLQREEGVRLTPYRDSRGYLTIGYGHCLDTTPISARAAEVILDDDVAAAEAAVGGRLPWARRLDPPRWAVLVGMAFQMGPGGLLGFTQMLTAVERGDWEAAAAAMLDSLWARQTPERARRLAEQMRTGAWV
jgi:lysozyme